jgi:chromosome segregation ATPase
MDGSSNVLSPLVRSLQGRLERAEEQVKRAREREKNLRERLEGDDVAHLLSAQRSQSEALRRENDTLRDRLKDAENTLESKEATIRRLTQQVENAPSSHPETPLHSTAPAARDAAPSEEHKEELRWARGELERAKAAASEAEAAAATLTAEAMQLRLASAEHVSPPPPKRATLREEGCGGKGVVCAFAHSCIVDWLGRSPLL